MNYTTYWANLYTDPIEEGNFIQIVLFLKILILLVSLMLYEQNKEFLFILMIWPHLCISQTFCKLFAITVFS